MNFLKVIFLMTLLSLLSLSCSKEKRAFNKLDGEWTIEKVEYLNQNEGDTLSLPSRGSIQFDNCSYSESVDGQSDACNFNYKFNENQSSQEGDYQLYDEPGNTETGFGLGLSINSEDTLNKYKIDFGGYVYKIDKNNLVFDASLRFVKKEYLSKVKIYCKK